MTTNAADHRNTLTASAGGTAREFWKLSGSGNDFVVFDVRGQPAAAKVLGSAALVQRLCARGTGVGADGVVLLAEPDEKAALAGQGEGDSTAPSFRMIYFNADGSRGEMCGNAALCSTLLAVEFGIAPASGMSFETDSGVVRSRITAGDPEIDLAPVLDVRAAFDVEMEAGESRIGFASVGVPHLVVMCDDVASVDVVRRGRELRYHPSLAAGANVNFVSPAGTAGGWDIRTYERGVEGETLACGTGATAAAIVLEAWGAARQGPAVSLTARSGLTLVATPSRQGEGEWHPSLRGQARIVFRGVLDDPV